MPAVYINHADSATIFVDDTRKPNVGNSNLLSHTTINTSSGNNAATDTFTISVIIGIITAILIVLIATVVIALVLFRRKSVQQKPDYDGSYSTLSRENAQQMQPQSLHTHAELYDQIKLSPSTGQTEFISKCESENINNSLPPLSLDTHPSVNTKQHIQQSTGASNRSLHDAEESTSEQSTYTVVEKNKKWKKKVRGKESAQSQDTAAEKEGDSVPLYDLNTTDQKAVEQRDQPDQKQDAHEETYAVVHKKSKKGIVNSIETATPIPSQKVDSLEELYTTVKKKPTRNTAEDEEEAPPLPPHTVEELYTAVRKKNIGHTN